MPRRLTIEEVQAVCSGRGTSLISEYVNTSTPITVKCENNHSWTGKLNDIKKRSGCPECSLKKVPHNKLTIEYIRLRFEEIDYTLLTTVYTGKKQKLEYICNQNHPKHSISWDNFNSGHRCPYCANQGKPTIEFIRSEFEKIQWTLKTTIYVNSSTKLVGLCDKGHPVSICWTDFRGGNRCSECRNIRLAKERRRSVLEIISLFKDGGFSVVDKLPEESVDSHTKVKVQCEKGHIQFKTLNKVVNGKQGCGICLKSVKYKYEEVLRFYSKRDYEFLEKEYKGARHPHWVRCPNSHETQIALGNFLKGTGCKICFYENPLTSRLPLTTKRLADQMIGRVSYEIKKKGGDPKTMKIKNHRKFFNDLAKEVLEVLGDRPTLSHELDHVIPCSFVDHRVEEEVILCWSIKNLAWLHAYDNRSKYDNISDDVFNRLTLYQRYIIPKLSFSPKDLVDKVNLSLPSSGFQVC